MINPFYSITVYKSENILKISSNNIFTDSHNPDKVMFNFSSYKLTDDKSNNLCKGLNFSVKLFSVKLIGYSEFSFRNIKREDLCNENMSLILARQLEAVLTSYQNFSGD